MGAVVRFGRVVEAQYRSPMQRTHSRITPSVSRSRFSDIANDGLSNPERLNPKEPFQTLTENLRISISLQYI